MTQNQSFANIFRAARSTLEYKVDGVIVDVTEQIVRRMSALGISRSKLADDIHVSAPYITKLLRGGTNFTAESLVKVANALDCDLEIKLVPRGTASDWFDVMDKSAEAVSDSRRDIHLWSKMKSTSCGWRNQSMHIQSLGAPDIYYHQSR